MKDMYLTFDISKKELSIKIGDEVFIVDGF